MSTCTQLTVGRVLPEQASRLRELRLRALADAPYAFAATLDDELDLPLDHWRGLIADSELTIHVADDGGPWLGMAGGRWHDHRAGVAQLWGMWVAPSVRGHGIADRLVDAVHAWAVKAGARRMRLGVVEGLPAQRFYERLGFTPTGETRPLTRDASARAVFYDRAL